MRAYDRLTAALDRLPRDDGSPTIHDHLRRVEELLFSVLLDGPWMEAVFASFPDATGRRVLREGRYLVHAQRAAPGTATHVHNHHTWGMHGVWRGHLREERFSRSSRPARAGRAYIRAGADLILRPGAIASFTPPGDVHRLSCSAERTTLSLHIYGRTAPAQQYVFRGRGTKPGEILAELRPA